MATNGTNGIGHFDPSSYPPFPEDIPSVSLETFSLAGLEKGDSELQDKLFETCKTRGFFYLDLKGSRASSMQSDANEIAGLAEKVFELPQAEKGKYGMKDSIFGFKPKGATKTDASGTPDTATFFNISKDAILDNTTRWPLPPPILAHKPLLARYMRTAHTTGLTILTLLGAKLGLPAAAAQLAALHRITEEAGDHVRMTYGPARQSAHLPEIQTPGHTDFGSITLLFNWLGGLQVWSDPARGGSFENVVDPRREGGAASAGEQPRWLWVRPPPRDHVIVNLGDAMVKWTGGVLCSGRHRVVPAPGEQGRFDRYSVVYFVRPEDKAVLKRLEAPGIPRVQPGEEDDEIDAKAWIIKQSRGLAVTIAN